MVTPGHVTVKRSKKDMSVRCSKQGYQDVVGTMPSDIDGWTLVNFVFLDLPGLGVDAWTGAINDYDDTYKLNMSQGYGASAPQDNYPSYPVDQPARARHAGPISGSIAGSGIADQDQGQDSSPYPAPTQQYNDQPQSSPDSLPPDSAPSYPDNSQMHAGFAAAALESSLSMNLYVMAGLVAATHEHSV